MKKLILVLFILVGSSIYADNSVSIAVKSNKVAATINLNSSEYIILNEQFLFLMVESEEYEFTFSGYPEGDLHDNGDLYYSDKVILEGDLVLKDGITPGEYNIHVILGYQSCDKDGLCNIPVEMSETIRVKSRSNSMFIIAGLLLVIIATLLLLLIRRKKS